MNDNEISIARSIISKIDSGESWVFGEHINTENEIAYKLFKDDSDKIIGVFFSSAYEKKIRIDIAFEYDINDEDINKNLLDLILTSKQKRFEIADNPIDIWLFNENRYIIKYLEAEIGNGTELHEKHTRYASVEYIMRRKNFRKSNSQPKNIIIKSYEAEKLDEYLIMLDKSMTFSPHNFREEKESMGKKLNEYSKADNKEFKAFWDNDTGNLIGVYWTEDSEINDLAVSPEYQRKGYGSFILTHAIERVLENPERENARLYCVDWNEKGQAFYKKYGMEVNGHSYQLTLNNPK